MMNNNSSSRNYRTSGSITIGSKTPKTTQKRRSRKPSQTMTIDLTKPYSG